MSLAFLLGSLFVLLFFGVPVAVALGVSALLSMVWFSSYDILAIPEIMLNGLKPALMAIPMFILAGSLMSRGSSSARIIAFAQSLVGHLPGGLPMSAILACIIFASISGSSPATVVAIGSVMFAALKNAGYPKRYYVGAITSAGSLGILIPPSVVMIIYGVSAEVSIEKLFIAGIVPGLLLGGLMMGYAYIGARSLSLPLLPKASLKERWERFKQAFFALFIIVIIIGGIYAGIFTATEAAGISAVYAFLISFFVYKDLRFRDIYEVFLDASLMSALIFFIIGFAVVFAHFLTHERIPHEIASYLLGMQIPWWVFLIFVNLVLFVMGQFMEPSSVVIIMTPLLLPIAISLGIDPIHFGIVMIVNMEIGMLTPPIGLNLFVASSLSGLSLKDVMVCVLPWVGILLFGLLLISYVPSLCLWLPHLLFD